jgi:molecular chaperone Hsp33
LIPDHVSKQAKSPAVTILGAGPAGDRGQALEIAAAGATDVDAMHGNDNLSFAASFGKTDGVREADRLERFLFESTRVRGELVSLDETFRAAIARHDYPKPVKTLLGEAMAASALLSSTIKFEGGSLTLQVQGNGPVHLLVAQCTSDRHLRGLVRWNGAVDAGPLPSLTGSGRLAITIDPGGDRERYQGIVELAGETLARSIEGYFAQSEQLDTRLWLAADDTHAAGMLLQRLPGENDPDLWNRVLHLAATLTPAELLGLPTREILRRLFHEEDVRLFRAEPVAFRCGCARTTIESVLRVFGREEAESILRERGSIDVTCEYCLDRYAFDSIDVATLFSETPVSPARDTRH